MSALVFVDTNVFLYGIDPRNPSKQEAAREWCDGLWRTKRGRTSFQVLQEFYSQAVRISPAARDHVRADIRDLLTWRPVPIDGEVLDSSWSIQDRYKIAFWDALIVAAAKRSGCKYIVTEDLQHGQELSGLVVVSPFRRGFDSVRDE